MQFSKGGPDIPAELLDAAICGDVLFLCGAGVSRSSGLPDFKALTEKIFERLGENMAPPERQAFEKDRFEETLGALARRLADKRRMYKAVAKELDAERATDISAHKTLLRLSRDFESRPVIVTTNFDTLFERALHAETGQPIGDQSFASAQVPAPGGAQFEGIIHLHGRLADRALGLNGSELVLTSADYGDAYLRSGWASRFLFDLVRTRTIVLIGYSASDPPVRYILNILEADRERFPEIKSVYAIEAHEPGHSEEAAAAWEAIAVRPITYELTSQSYMPLWRDLTIMADLTETPPSWRKKRFDELTTKSPSDLEDWEIRQVVWLVGYDDVLARLPTSSLSAEWFGFLRSRAAIMPSSSNEWYIAEWAAKHLDDETVFTQMLALAERLSPAAAGILDRGLDVARVPPIPAPLKNAWQLLTIVLRQSEQNDPWHYYSALDRIRAGVPTNADLAVAVAKFEPRLRLREPYQYGIKIEGLPGLCRVELEPERDVNYTELLAALPPNLEFEWQALNLASERLLAALRLARDADQPNRVTSVPSIGEHEQNKDQGGFLSITRLCAELWLKVHAQNPDGARAIAHIWKHAGFGLATRLWLFTMLKDTAASPDEIVRELTALSREEFWAHRKEVIELLKNRCVGSPMGLIGQLASKIIEGPNFMEDRDEADRQRGLDSTRWLYLKALVSSGVILSENAQTEFDAINARENWNERPLEERDLFWVWSFGLRYGPTGDPGPIAEADPIRRIEIAAGLEQHDPINQPDAWRIYCKQEPDGALDAIIASDPDAAKADRWRDVLWGIQDIGTDEASKDRARELAAKALSQLSHCQDSALSAFVGALVDFYIYACEIAGDVEDVWWDRLWRLSDADTSEVALGDVNKDPGYELLLRAMNRPAGKLVKLMLNRLGPGWSSLSEPVKRQTKDRLSEATNAHTVSGMLARAESTRFIAWINAFLPDLLDSRLYSRLIADTLEGEALRSILVGMALNLSKGPREKLKEPILRGIREHRGGNDTLENAASRLVSLVRDDFDRSIDDPTRLKIGEAKAVLSTSRSALRADVAQVMGNWLLNESERPTAELWQNEYAEIFEQIWPVTKKDQTTEASIPLARLALAAGDAFPDAWDIIRPYIRPLNEEWPRLYFAVEGNSLATAAKFPRVTLDLLWVLLKPASTGRSYELGKVLDCIAAAAPALQKDRKFQLLETRVIRAQS
ncbi:SIR2 family protein [Hyphomicrobium sp. ghe19]|uniref:SIR2 family NAD-dependent protein deacylase n=1 Tax=Hyphomicrobium sp. ghe19 TaxID=2682968 RepID=UPI001367702F|nr:NAD-dependent protein deacylase [Hyphomicrobium sp. ghe19]